MAETKSNELPIHLEDLQKSNYVDALLTSPVFGTGIDVDRLGLMNIMNQPKTTSGYIQATGRVGRSNKESSCILLYNSNLSSIAHSRLKILKENNDGFNVSIDP